MTTDNTMTRPRTERNDLARPVRQLDRRMKSAAIQRAAEHDSAEEDEQP